MVRRTFWIDRIEAAWKRRRLVWLSGLRRSGKTFLSRSLADVEYYDCELPRTRRPIDQDPEGFLQSLGHARVVLDEVHRLKHPTELLKIATDHFPRLRLLATGSSTLAASTRFRDTLTGRKLEVHLTPMIHEDLTSFAGTGLPRRLLHGGLPPFFLEEQLPEAEFEEWLDSFWARDIQEHFRLERRHSFHRFMELIFLSSGGLFEATRFAGPCEVSRPTISNYLAVLEAAHAVTVLRPFSSRRSSEIISASKVYAFDTGFLCHVRGWRELRSEDLGLLWEHYVLNEILARAPTREVRYWRDKRAHEVDFVLLRRGGTPGAVECKWSASGFDARNLQAFRRQYPDGPNWIVARDVARSYEVEDRGLTLRFMGLEDLIEALSGSTPT